MRPVRINHDTPTPELPGSEGGARSPLHAQLRAATAALHGQLESQLDLLGAALSMRRYRRVLEVFLGFYSPVEAQLRLLAPAAPPLGVPLQARALLLQRDLVALGMTPADLTALPQCGALPRLHEPEHMAGCLYVLEGASLGGRIIARALDQRLALRNDSGAAFFGGDGAGTAVRWKRVLRWLEEFADSGAGDGARPEKIVASACETFSALARWLQLQGISR
jgi:heme oxygenase